MMGNFFLEMLIKTHEINDINGFSVKAIKIIKE